MAARKLGQILVDLGFITDDHLEMLVEEQSQNPGQLIGRVAQEMGLVTEEQLNQALGEQFNIQALDIDGYPIPQDAKELISDAMAQLYRVIPLKLDDDVLTIASCDPQNIAIQDELRRFLGLRIRLVVAPESQVLKLIDKHFNSDTESIETLIKGLEEDDELKSASEVLGGDGPINIADINELVDSNVSGALNSNLAFYRGMATSEQFSDTLSESFMLTTVWGQEPEIREETESWTMNFSTLAYAELSDAEMQQYIDVSASEAGQKLNAALFAGFDKVFETQSFDLGRATAEFSIGEDT